MTLRSLAQQIVLVFDGDPVGQAAMARAFLPAEETDVPVEVVTLPATYDPDSYVRAHGPAALEALLTQAVPLAAYVLQQLVTQCPKHHAGSEVLALAEQIPGPVRQLLFLQQAEARLQLPAGSLSEVLGIGDTARQQLEETLSELVLAIPEVRSHLRGVLLPLRNAQLRTVVQRALQHEHFLADEHGPQAETTDA